MDYRIEFSKRLIQLREQRGITQQELADKPVSYTHLTLPTNSRV